MTKSCPCASSEDRCARVRCRRASAPRNDARILAELKPAFQGRRHGDRRQFLGNQRWRGRAVAMRSRGGARALGLTPMARVVASAVCRRRTRRHGTGSDSGCAQSPGAAPAMKIGRHRSRRDQRGVCRAVAGLYARPGDRPGQDERERRRHRARVIRSERAARALQRRCCTSCAARRTLRTGDDVHRRRPGHRNDRSKGCVKDTQTMTHHGDSDQDATAYRRCNGAMLRTAQQYDDANPATGAVIAEVASASRCRCRCRRRARAQGVRDRKVGDRWRHRAAAKIVYKMAQLIGERANELALLEVRDNGKADCRPPKASSARSSTALSFTRARRRKITAATLPARCQRIWPIPCCEPVGVVGAIVPWNFPLLLASWKVAPALAAGCTIVLKPAPSTPLTAIELGKIALEAGVPEGVLNIVTGPGRELGAGSSNIPASTRLHLPARPQRENSLPQRAAQTLKRVTLELGGKSPSMVFDDADIDAAVAGALYGILLQCRSNVRGALAYPACRKPSTTSSSRSFVEKAEQLRIGNPEDPQTHVGAITMRRAV